MIVTKEDIVKHRLISIVILILSVLVAVFLSKVIGGVLIALSLMFLFAPYEVGHTVGEPSRWIRTKVSFVDIDKITDGYQYLYVVLMKRNFEEKYILRVFTAQSPDYMLTEIQEAMKASRASYDDLNHGEKVDLEIGTVSEREFDENDIKKYGVDVGEWPGLLDEAIDKQDELTKLYRK